MSFSSDVLTIERAGHVATLWLDRPEKRNAKSLEFWRDLPLAMAELGGDPEIRAVVMAGRGRSFCVGLDLTALGGISSGVRGEKAASPADVGEGDEAEENAGRAPEQEQHDAERWSDVEHPRQYEKQQTEHA